ncbi:MAG TPA: alpha/beta hydrolase [Polyangiales bacterium]|nr:alpha/beta hydrolase [Polyangiales bacterium]
MKSIAQRFFAARVTVPAFVTLSAVFLAMATIVPLTGNAKESPADKPTVVLIHGAFAESSSWSGITTRLLAEGYPVVAAANPLRGVKSDASYVASVIDSIKGPVILVGHSYGGIVISTAAIGKSNVQALVYVAAFAPDVGESALTLSSKFPGSSLGQALAPPVPLSDGNKDLYIQQEKFFEQFAADVPASEAKVMAATQRPVTEAALNEPAGTPAWKTIPSWFIYGGLDKNIPAAVHAFMAERAHARKVVAVKNASHVVMISHPDALVKMIGDANTATRANPASVRK